MSKIDAILLGMRATKPKRSSTTPESAVVHAVKQWAKDKPDVYIVRVVQAGEVGVPDFLLCVCGRFVGVECKATGQAPRTNQHLQLGRITAAGGFALWGDADTLIPELNTIYQRLKK
jgi:VRR-NUC domain|nr:MAG TPA: Nuclease [Caudoviricetes sp.]